MVFTTTVTEEEQAVTLTLKQTAFDLPHATSTNGRVVPIQHGPDKNVDFGAEIYGIDLNKLTDADFGLIHDALHRHKLLVFKEQPRMLKPQQQYILTAKYAPSG